ncbi:hypothetical protein [Lapidilactobacillus bayanensis]|uniref:hypothetical protein n=1 Tax=Lapidilactobacillus bayanensis TaxID=2485998 RepID=UPI000F7757A3|nr:hypothetical protein [Lapidilactobacillus bayanensis]
MTPEQFTHYINDHSSIIITFRRSASDYQYEKNAERKPIKQYSDERVEHEIDLMVAAFLESVYTSIKSQVKENRIHPYESWVNYIESNSLMDLLEEDVETINLD